MQEVTNEENKVILFLSKVVDVVLTILLTLWKVVKSLIFRILVILSIVIWLGWFGFTKVTEFTNKHEAIYQPLIVWAFPRLQAPVYWVEKKPIEILTPVVVEPIKEKEVQHLTIEEKRAIIYKVAKNYPKQVERIWMLESTEGEITPETDPTALHLFCHNLGLTNDFGFDPQGKGTGQRCFNTFEESVEAVDSLLTKFLGMYTLNESLCLYSGHGVTNTCTYLDNYKTL